MGREGYFFLYSGSPSWVRDGVSMKLSLDETKYLLLYSRIDIYSTRKGTLVLKTRSAVGTKSGHEVIVVIKKLEIYLERNTTFSYRLSSSELVTASVPRPS